MSTLFDLTPEAPATPVVAGPGPYTITLPAGLPLLNANRRVHHRVRHDRTKAIRAAAMEAVADSPALMAALAQAKPDPLFQRAHILGILHPASARRADPANWYPSFKAAVDGLVDAGLLDDDDHTRLVGPDMRLGEKRKGSQLALVVRGLAAGEDPLGYEAVNR